MAEENKIIKKLLPIIEEMIEEYVEDRPHRELLTVSTGTDSGTLATSLALNGNNLELLDGAGNVLSTVDATPLLLDENVVSGLLNATSGIATFTTDEGNTFDVDLSALLDNFGTVTTATAVVTTTNGVTVAIGDSYIEFPDGTTWSTTPYSPTFDTGESALAVFTPTHWDTTWVASQGTPALSAEALVVATGQAMSKGVYEIPGHGLIVGEEYVTDPNNLGGIILRSALAAGEPYQKLFTVPNANEILVDVQPLIDATANDEKPDASNLNGAPQDLSANLLSLLPDRVGWHFHVRQPTVFTAGGALMNVTVDGENAGTGVTTHTVPDGAQGFAIRVGTGYQVNYQTANESESVDTQIVASVTYGMNVILDDRNTPDGVAQHFQVYLPSNPTTLFQVPAGNTLQVVKDGVLTNGTLNDAVPTGAHGFFYRNGTDYTLVYQTLANTGISADPDQQLTLGSDNLPYLGPECTDVTEQFVTGATSNPGNTPPSGILVTEITVNKTQDITVVHTGTGFTGSAGSGWGIADAPMFATANSIAAANVYSSTGDRIDAATPSKTYTVSLTPGTYYIGVWSGGLSGVTSHTLDITYCKPVVDVDVRFVESRCYEEPGAALPILDNDAFADEINPTQLATLPAGAHMRWTAPSAVTLDTLEVNGFNGTVAISWSASTGDTGSQSVTFGANPQGLNLGIVLPAGGTIDFTLDSISAGQMQLSPAAASISNGWTALQDYSAFANTSHWATRLLTSAAAIEHKVNVYEDTNGDTVYAEVNGEDLTDLTTIPGTWTLCPTVPIVSADTDNDLTEGSDGGAYYKADKLDVCGVNEYIHNIKPWYMVLSKEGPSSGPNVTTSVNGVPSVYDNLVNSIDLGNGELSWNAGNNGNFNSHATTPSIVKCDEYIELVKGNTPNFHTEAVSISSTNLTSAQTYQGDLRVVLGPGGYTLYDTSNTVVATGGQEAGTYRFTRTLYGFKVEKDGVEIYTTPETCTDYNTAEPLGLSTEEGNIAILGDDGNIYGMPLKSITCYREIATPANEYTVMEYSDGEFTKLIYHDTSGSPIELIVIPPTWEVCPETTPEDAIEVQLDGNFTLPTAVDGDVHHFSVEALPVSIDTTGGEPIDGDLDFSRYTVGDQLTALPQQVGVLGVTGTPITATQPDNSPNTVTWDIVPGVVELTRGTNGGLLNSAQGQSGNNGGAVTITDVEWFYDQGNTELPIAPTSVTDTTTPTTTSMSAAFDGAIGDEILAPLSYIRVISTGQVFQLDFTAWQQGGGGGFSGTATEMTMVLTLGWNVRKSVGEFISADANNALQRRADGLYVEDTNATAITVLSSFNGTAGPVEKVSVNGVPFLCMADNEATFTSFTSSEIITPRDVTADVYIDFTIKRATTAQPDSTFRQTSNFTAYFQELTFNAETGVASVSSGGGNGDPEIILADVGTEFIRYVVRFTEMPGSFSEAWRFRPAGNTSGADTGTIYITEDGFTASVEDPTIAVQPSWITNSPGTLGQVLTANGDGTATWT